MRKIESPIPAKDPRPYGEWNSFILRVSTYLLVGVVWGSMFLFGLYIFAFYLTAMQSGNLSKWNDVLPGLYNRESKSSTINMGVHFLTGGVILLLGSIQLIKSIRLRYPTVHRWIGRIYLVASVFAAVGGLAFITITGTIGGVVMDVGFSLYGILTLIAALQAYRHAIARQFDQHRLWSLRLYALAIGSWIYRMDYGFWMIFTHGLGHIRGFKGPFDQIMAFFFYIPNLIVVEAFIRTRTISTSSVAKVFVSFLFVSLSVLLGVGTYYFTKFYWGKAILGWLDAFG